MQDAGRRKVRNARQIFVLQILGGVQTTAGKDGILDAGNQKILETRLQIGAVQSFQQTVLCIVGQVTQMVPVDLIHSAAGLLHERPTNIRFLCGAILPPQRLYYSGTVFFPHFPQVGCPRSLDRTGIRYVKNVLQSRPAAAVLVNQSYAL